MKKISFLVLNKEYQNFLEHLRELGVVHIQERQNGEVPSELSVKIQSLGRYKTILSDLENRAGAMAESGCADAAESEISAEYSLRSDMSGDEVLAVYDRLCTELSEYIQTVGSIDKQIQVLEPWGDFSMENVGRLASAGYDVSFHVCTERAWNDEWIDRYNAVVINELSGKKFFLTITPQNVQVDMDVESVLLPEKSLSELQSAAVSVRESMSRIDKAFSLLAGLGLPQFKKKVISIQQDIEFSNVVLNTENVADDYACCLEGWVPADSVSPLKDYLDGENCLYCLENPTPEDNVPIKLKNGRFASLFEPLTDMYSLPNYSELDPTAAFAPFFTLFFGLCLGDGGYGLLVLLACTFAKKKFPALRSYATMGQWLGASTILVGLLTGMVFGVSLDSVPWPWLAGVRNLFVTSNNYQPFGYDPMMVFAICVGVLQILFAMGFKIVRTTIQFGIKYALSDLGWLVLLVTAIVYLILKVVAGMVLSDGILYVFYLIAAACGVLIFFFNSPGKNPFLNFGSGLWGAYNMISGLLGDVLSYIRLFALGLAGGILGGVFNSLAFQAGGALPAWISWLPTAFILLFGHGLNLFLCVISSIVHPLRLTYVEFFKNAGFEGGGRKYKPFSK